MGISAIEVLKRHRPEWTKVVDADEELFISVRKEDAGRANKKDPESCAVALACERRGLDALIYFTRAYIGNKDGTIAIRYDTSKELRTQLAEFDRTGKFKAGLYRLQPVCESQRLTGKRRHQPKGRYKVVATRKKRNLTVGIRRFG